MKQLALLLACLPLVSLAQEISIASGSYTGCGAFVLDSGMNPASYGTNENYTFVACAEAPETVVNLTFVLFDLVNADDVMTLYDGPDTDAALIGSYTAFELQGQNIFSGITGNANPSGCITVVFVSGAIGGGDFAFGVSCGEPCFNPFVIVETGLTNPALVCPGQSITFDASTSITGEGSVIESYFWEFGDGETATTDGPIITHTYSNPGAFRLDLTVTDNNECQNANLADLLFLVSTDPTFDGTSAGTEICLGQEVDLSGAVAGVTWDATPDPNLGGGFVIPDDQTQCFDSQLTFTGFAPNAEVESVNDFESFFVNMEHSFMGDLIISFICPNGQSIIVHQQGGGGTDLGIPVTGDEANPIAGTGFDYWWSPTATNGTWAQASAGVNTLPSGTYSSVQPWSNLIGCPLNGTWTIEICDIFAIDNGHVFDWAVIFAPELYPELITFTPTFGADCDSTFWSGEGITSANENCNNITVEPTDLGTWIYTYNATNNHGCTYTVDVEVEVVQGPIASAPELAYYCNDQAILQGSVSNPQPGQLYAYSWSPDAFLNNPSSSSPVVNNLTEPTTFTLTVFPAGAPECASSTDVLVDIPPPPVPLVTDEVLEACFGTTLTIASPNQPEGWNYFFEWTNIDEPENVLWDGQNYSAASPGTYQLVVTMVEPCMYSASGVVEVEFESCELGPIPNIFSPNNDGINDSFAIEGLERFSDVRFVVYNRWGTLVFESENYRNNWRPSPDELSDGTYFFVLTVPFPTKPEPEVYTGTLQVVRTTRP